VIVAGSFFLADGREWHSSSSTFFWVLDALANHTTDKVLADHLLELIEFNVGFFGVEELADDQRVELLSLVGRLLKMVRAIPVDEPYRDSFIAQVDELATLAAAPRP
jgi:hypothetical protein